MAIHTDAIIILIKNPELGKAKTRLAKGVGDERALEIYLKLLEHTHAITCVLEADKYLFYSDHVDNNDIWDNTLYRKSIQNGADLGERMRHAFDAVFSNGHKSVLIIGSDCKELTAEIITEAFAELHSADTVVGPTHDGGYYLLGMNKLIPQVFQDKEWSTETVLSSTLSDLEQNGLSNYLLPKLSDIDTIDDLPEEWR